MGMTPPYLDPTRQEALYEVDGRASEAMHGDNISLEMQEAGFGPKEKHRFAIDKLNVREVLKPGETKTI